MKKIAILLLALMFLLSFTGCANNSADTRVTANEGDSAVDTGTEAEGNAAEAAVTASEGNFVVGISINPEVQFVVDSETGLVTDVVCLNSDAEDLINKLGLNLIGLSYDEAAETFMKAAADENYLNASNNDITVSADGEASDEIYDTYGEKMEAVCQNVDDYTDFDITMELECFPCHGTGQCDLCNGAGGYTCTECNGAAGNDPCPDCGGNGYVSCSGCSGTGGCTSCGKTGVMVCDQCGGSGCDNCGGSGKMECTACHGHYSCEECGGSGEQQCLTCAGTGKVCCHRCNSTGTETCPRCDGTGLCNTCHGNGMLTEDQLIP